MYGYMSVDKSQECKVRRVSVWQRRFSTLARSQSVRANMRLCNMNKEEAIDLVMKLTIKVLFTSNALQCSHSIGLKMDNDS